MTIYDAIDKIELAEKMISNDVQAYNNFNYSTIPCHYHDRVDIKNALKEALRIIKAEDGDYLLLLNRIKQVKLKIKTIDNFNSIMNNNDLK